MKFKQFVNYLIETKKENQLIEKSINQSDVKKLYVNNFKLTKAKNKFFDNFFDRITPENVKQEIFDRPSSEQEKEKAVNSFVLWLSKVVFTHIGSKASDQVREVRDDKNLSFEEKFNKSMSILNDECSKKSIDSENKLKMFKTAIAHSQKEIFNNFSKEEDVERFQNTFNEMNEEELDNCVPDPIDYATPEEEPGIDLIHDKLDEIDDMKSKLDPKKDKATIDMLDKCNDILVTGKGEFVNLTSEIAEHVGEANDANKVNDLEGELKSQGYKDTELNKTSRFVYIKKEGSTPENEKAKIIEGIKNVDVPEDEKANLKGIINDMIEWGIFTPGNFEAESGSKEYGFSKLVKAKNELSKAVDSKDTNKIRESYDKYKDLESKYDNLMERLSSVNDNEFFTSNISPAREKAIPTKIRNNPKAASRLSGIWLALGFFNAANKDIYKAIDDPASVIKEISTEIVHEDSPIISETKNNEFNISDVIYKLDKGPSGEYFKINGKTDSILHGFDRAFNSLGACLNKKSQLNYFTEASKAQLSHTEAAAEISGSTIIKGLRTNSKEFIKNMIVASGNDFNIHKLRPDIGEYIDPETGYPMKKFDSKDYFEKNNVTSSMIFKMNNLADFGKTIDVLTTSELNDTVIKAVKETAKMALESNKEKTDLEKSLLTSFSNGKRPPKADMMKYEYLQKGLNINSQSSIDRACETYAALKDQYNQRSFFAKLFFKSAKNQKLFVNQMKNDLIASGVSEEKINDVVSNHKVEKHKEEKIVDYQKYRKKEIRDPSKKVDVPVLGENKKTVEKSKSNSNEQKVVEKDISKNEKSTTKENVNTNSILDKDDQTQLQNKLGQVFDSEINNDIKEENINDRSLEKDPIENVIQ